MITIGIRATPRALTFAIYNSDADAIVNVEDIKIPAAFSTPDGLKYLRNNLLDVLREYGVERAGVRVTETTAQSPNVGRIQIEGVVQEAFASSSLIDYYVGQIATISAKLRIDRTDFKKFVDGEKDFPVENWEKMSKERREAVLCAMGAANV
jgi:hypothetical protein